MDQAALVRELGHALGLFAADGSFDSGWLADPAARLKAILTDAPRRAALGRVLDEVIPGPAGDRAGWHPLLWSGDGAPPPFGNLFLVFEPRGPETEIGIAGEFSTAPGAPFGFSLGARVPLLRTRGSELDAAVGGTAGALELYLTLRPPASSVDVRLDEIRVRLRIAVGDATSVATVAEVVGFRLGSAPPRTLLLDGDDLSGDAIALITGVVQEAVQSAPEPFRSHLLPVLGADPTLPQLPWADLVADADAVRRWLAALADAGRLGDWFSHLGALLGAAAPVGVAPAGSRSDPWVVALASGGVRIALTLAVADGRLYPGVTVRAGADAAVHLAADFALLGIALRGALDPELLPEASVTVRSPTPLLAPVMAPDGTTVTAAAGGARAGFALAGGRLRPMIELSDVVLAGQRHPRIDLTNLDAVGGLAANAAAALLVAALGSTPAGLALLALIGVVAPTHAITPGDVWSQPDRPRLDVVRFLSDPVGALAAFHRAALASGGWGALLGELAALIGLETITSASIAGSGTAADPWVYTLARSGPLEVRFAAWGAGADTLRLGGEIGLAEGAFRVALRSEVVRLDLPAGGAPEFALLREHHAGLTIAPIPPTALDGRVRIGADRLSASVDWTVGSVPRPQARVDQVALEVAGTALPRFDVTFPVAGAPAFDDRVLRALLALAAQQAGGPFGSALLALLGIARHAALPDDFPLLPGDLQAAFLGRLRPFAGAVAGGASAGVGEPHLVAWLRLLSALFTDAASAPALAPRVLGSGTEADPLRAALHHERVLELLAWWGTGPSTDLLAAALARAGDSEAALARAALLLRAHVPSLHAALGELDDARLEFGVAQLAAFFAASDGLVPLASQAPAPYTPGARVVATHSRVPRAAAADVRAAVGAAPALLLSAPFTDRTSWSDVIAGDATAHFDLRQGSVPPEQVDLRTVDQVVQYYTADLAGLDGTSLAAQIGRLLDRLQGLRPGEPVVLVAHSITGRAAVAAAAAAPGRVVRVVTLATPHLGALPPYLFDLSAGVALDVARALRARLPAEPVAAALDEAAAVIASSPPDDGVAPVPAWMMTEAPEPPAAILVPVLAISAVAVPAGSTSLLAALATALQASAPSDVPASPTLGLGLALNVSGDEGDESIAVRTRLRLDLGELGLADGSADRVRRRVTVSATIERPNDWLLGGPGVRDDGTPWPARVRAATLHFTWDGAALATRAELTQAALAGPARSLTLGDAEAPALLDAVFAALAAEPVPAASATSFIATLRALGLLVPDEPRLAADALAALRADGAVFLAPRIRTALSARFLDHDPTTGRQIGPFTLHVGAGGDLRLTSPLRRLGTIDLGVDMSTLAVSGAATVRVAGMELAWEPGGLTVTIPPWLGRTSLWPVAAPAGELVPRLVLSTAASALLQAVLPARPGFPILDRLLIAGAGLDAADLALDQAHLGDTLGLVLRQLGIALGLPPSEGLALPHGLLLTAAAGGDGRLVVRLRAGAPVGGVLGLDVALRFGPHLQVQPEALITVQMPDPPADAPADAWRDVGVELSLAGSVGLAMRVGATRVQLLPTFGGWQSLLAGGVALLPRALDEITPRIPASPVKQAVLDVAAAFNLFGPTWAAHTADFQNLLSWSFDETARGQIVAAAEALLAALGLPGTLERTGRALSWTAPALPAPVAGPLTITLDWSAPVPAVSAAAALTVTAAAGGGSALERVALRLGLDASLREGGHVVASITLDQPFATNVLPRLDLGVGPGSGGLAPIARVLPLAGATTPGPLVVALLPAPAATLDAVALPGAVAFDVVLPLVVAVLERATGSTALWPGGPTARAVVDASGLFGADRRLTSPPPDLPTVVGNVAGALSATIDLGPLALSVGRLDAGSRVGVSVAGHVPVPLDTVELRIVFGEVAGDGERTELTLLRRAGAGFAWAPAISANHFGMGLRGAEGRPLISTDAVRLGGGDAYAFFDVAVDLADAALETEFRGAGAALEGLGVSLGAARGGDNPIAGGLMRSAASGDGTPPQPPFDLTVEYVNEPPGHEGHGGGWTLRAHLGEEPDERRAWIGLHAAFGPLYIDQVGVELEDTEDPDWIKLLVDGGVSVAGFAAQVDDLSVQMPFTSLGDPAAWSVDLAGLGVAYRGAGVSVLGGLVKRTLDPPDVGVEYAGLLQVRLQNLGAVAVGAWSRLRDAGGDLESLFVFAAVFVTVPFPPYFEMQGLGAGFGYNRALVVPDDVSQVPGFALVRVLDDPAATHRPLAVLESLRTALPARRGSLWFAAGIRGALFTVIDLVAVVYVALDRTVEVGVVGVGRVEQPRGNPIIVIELALKARFSSAEGVLSIQAQLTDRSWLLMPECQLTGGFALVIWFPRGTFVFTVGGYHPAFAAGPEFPQVPRLGYRCTLRGVIQLKGESYFALTNSCVMAGTRFEAAYDIGWLRAWFRAWCDFLIAWDPFHYDASIGVELGADFTIEIDLLFGSVTVHFSVSVGARLHVVGPPLHGEVHADLGPISITVPFGDRETGEPPLLTWEEFRDRYVLAGAPGTVPVSVQPATGLAPLAAGAAPPQGATPADAWRFEAEFSVVTATAMPASRVADPLGAVAVVAGVDVDFAPMHETTVETTHRLRIRRRGGGVAPLDPDRFEVEQRLGDFAEAVWRYLAAPRADARNIRALAGMTVRAVAEPLNPSAAVPILTLVDVGDPRPLPFARHGGAWRAATVRVGDDANRFANTWADVAPERLLAAGSPAHAGLPFRTAGLSGSATRALARRAAPPVVAPLSEGMDLGSPDRGTVALPPRRPVAAPTPELTLASASRFPPAQQRAVRATTVSRAAPAGASLPRMAPPTAKRGVGTLVRTSSATPETLVAAGVPTLPRGPAAERALEVAMRRFGGEGLELAAGVVQLWTLPPGAWTVVTTGDAARIVALARGGRPLLDVELAGDATVALPERSEAVAIWSLGRASATVSPGFAAISAIEAPASPIATGWHVSGHLQLVDPFAALGRGASLRLSRAVRGAGGLERAAAIMREQPTVETRLSPHVTAVLVSGAVTNPTTADLGDLRVAVSEAELGTPLLFESAGERAALYAVAARGPFSVTVGSVAGFRLTGVAGLRGEPRELAARLHGTSLGQLVANGPLSADGSVRVSLRTGGPG